jgi:hypothetical protein
MGPTADPRRFGPWRQELAAFAELFAFTGILIAQPTLDAVSSSQALLVGLHIDAVDAAVFTAVVVVLPALVLWLAEVIVGLVIPRGRRLVHAALIGVLAGILANDILKGSSGSELRALIGVVVISAATFLYLRWSVIGQWLQFLSIAPLIFAVMFAFDIQPLIEADSAAVSAPVGSVRPTRVVLVVFDELPLESLLDGSGHIDASAFPNFAALAATSNWYRNTMTVADHTRRAFPAIVTGQMPSVDGKVPVASEFPQTLFSSLAGSHRMNVHEVMESLCPRTACPDPPAYATRTGLAGLLTIGARSAVAFNHLERSRPAAYWRFAQPAALPRADRFVASIKPSDEPVLDYAHFMFPHQPWRWLGPSAHDSGNRRTHFGPWRTAAAASEARRLHLLSLQATDSLLGRVLQRLRTIGALDDSLVVVTADHGVAFTAGELNRDVTSATFDQILWTPLFVKLPHQQVGEVIDHPARSVDVVPTIDAVLGVKPPWTMDGHSLLEPARADPIVPVVSGDVEADAKVRRFERAEGFARVLRS